MDGGTVARFKNENAGVHPGAEVSDIDLRAPLDDATTAAYDGLNRWVKTAIEGMEAVHDLKLFRLGVPDTPEGRARRSNSTRISPRSSTRWRANIPRSRAKHC